MLICNYNVIFTVGVYRSALYPIAKLCRTTNACFTSDLSACMPNDIEGSFRHHIRLLKNQKYKQLENKLKQSAIYCKLDYKQMYINEDW